MRPENVYAYMNQDNIHPTPLYLMDFGIETRCGKDYYFDNRKRELFSGYLFQYTLDGIGYLQTDDSCISLTKGSAFFVKIPHNSSYYSLDTPWKFYYIHFDGTIVESFYQSITSNSRSIFTFNTNDFLNFLLHEYDQVKQGKRYERYESGVFLYEFLTKLLRESENPQLPPISTIERGREWIDLNYTTTFSLSELCSNLQITLAHFSRQFTKVYGINPKEYITNLRLEYSLQLLLNTNLCIQDIAIHCGFENGNYYAKVFRRTHGMSPTQYRSQH